MRRETLQVLSRSAELVVIASSRMPRSVDVERHWLAALRTAAARVKRRGGCLLTSPGTTTDRWVVRLAEQLRIPCVGVQPVSTDGMAAPDAAVGHWMRPAVKAGIPAIQVCRRGGGNSKQQKRASTADPTLQRDRLLLQLASHVVLLSVRQGGNLERAAMDRLAVCPSQKTELLIDDRLTRPAIRDRLLHRGARGWWLSGAGSRIPHRDGSIGPSGMGFGDSPRLEWNEVCRRRFLFHWTRRCDGPWPGQREEDYLDEMLFSDPPVSRSARATLRRILRTGCLRASDRWTRDSTPVVCFTEQTPVQYLDLRRFRPHLGRWDFERYGIAFDVDWLSGKGARRVVYGTESQWSAMPAEQRAWFQKFDPATSSIDWRAEREWRWAGDLDLRRVPPWAAFSFVGHASDLPSVRRESPWPVIVLPAAGATPS